MDIVKKLSAEFNCREQYVENVVSLIDAGNTIPFIARYRKEMHGTMDDQLLREIADRLSYLRGLDKRRGEISSSIEEQGKLTPELMAGIAAAATLAELEDIYRPYKQKRRTRATIARERGLQPLADILLAGADPRPEQEIAAEFIDAEKGVEDAAAALAGASDIIAEQLSDEAELRKALRALFTAKGMTTSKAAKQEDSVYRNYYDYSETIKTLQSHRVLALNRGEKEEFLKVSLSVETEDALREVKRFLPLRGNRFAALLEAAAEDSYSRLIEPSVEREIRAALTDMASEQAIRMFALNLKPLLMQPPIRGKVTMGFDPAYRTGCKIAVVDATGKVLDTAVVYPTPPNNDKEKAMRILTELIKKHGVTAISIGNGTASKESEIFVAEMLKQLPGVSYMVVNEAGASVYSASKLGAAEFPEYDVSLRSAVSIARRLQDPLAELVKIDPQSIGVGQYQHDMPPARLGEVLGGVVEDCVNSVGVDVNTASPSLLAHVAGLNAATAKNIVAYREQNGAFKDRRTLLKVAKLGAKAFEQCAGFLRVVGGEDILDDTSVHPESYGAARSLIKLCGYGNEVGENGFSDIASRLVKIGEQAAAESCGVGVPTVHDIAQALAKPGRDPRDELPLPMLRTDVMNMKDLKPGMRMRGTVRNVIDFGVFVDIGVHQDGLVHISELSDRYIKHPSEVVKVGDVVDVIVLSCDEQKKRISLSIKRANKPE